MTIGKAYSLIIKPLLITGFCGGFTIFSTFAFENVELMQNQQIGLALFYIVCSVIVGILFTWLGIVVGKGLLKNLAYEKSFSFSSIYSFSTKY